MSLKIRLNESVNEPIEYVISSIVGTQTDKATGKEQTVYGGHVVGGSIPYHKSFIAVNDLLEYVLKKLRVNPDKAAITSAVGGDTRMVLTITRESGSTVFTDDVSIIAYKKVPVEATEIKSNFEVAI